tara:strand:- start:183 stop:1490 length:1308 start_codon:yes stop_codon:yes gene_type:complete
MNLLNNKLFLLFLLLFVCNCSFDNKTGLWKKEDLSIENKNIKIILKNKQNYIKEVKPDLKIIIASNPINESFVNNLNNNNGQQNYDGALENLGKYKFSSIKNFNKVESEIIVHDNGIIFFNKKGTILKFNNKSKIDWKRNIYLKSEKKMNPILSMSLKGNVLVVADNLARYYAIDAKSGNLIWERRNSSPFNSQIKISDDKIYIVDYENILRCFSLKTGDQIWNIKTENSFIKSKKKLSIAISEDKIYFNNYIGDIGSVDANSGELIWQTPTQKNSVYQDAFLLETSDIVLNDNNIFFSNNKNKFLSISKKNGFINWEKSINSTLRPTIIDNLIFTISMNGYFVILDKETGEVIRSTYIFDQIKNKKIKNLLPTGFIVGSNKIYLSTNKGYLIVVNISSGKTITSKKIAGSQISRPYLSENNFYILKSGSVIKFN